MSSLTNRTVVAALLSVTLLGCSSDPRPTPDLSTRDHGGKDVDKAPADGRGDNDSGRPVRWVFWTGFETPGAGGTPADAHTRLTLENLARPAADQLQLPSEVEVGVYYEGGAPVDRFARLVDDPTANGNRVLHYWLENAAVSANFDGHTKGRIQTAFNPDESARVTELYARQRLYLHPDWRLALDYPDPDDWWLSVTVQEIWIGNVRKHPTPGRLSFRIGGNEAGQPTLTAGLDKREGQRWAPVWDATATREVPIAEWFIIETGYKSGDAQTGRLVVTLRRDGESTATTVIDRTDWTHSPEATDPVPISGWNPQKLYTSDNVAHHVRDRGGVLQIYWDDFGVSDEWPTNWPP